ncbi:TPA: malonate decarboxylase holo-ACP synthase [Pseudomonas putida]
MHAPRPHDLLWGMTPAMLPADAPAWAQSVLAAGEPVVVRRALVALGSVAVGVRGRGREQRFAWAMRLADVERRVSPEALRGEGALSSPALHALSQVSVWLSDHEWSWGPTGSTGFQLATGIEVLHAGSDLDLLLRAPESIPRDQAARLLSQLEGAACRVDAQLETPLGAVALREWASGARRVLLKSATGARLVSDPWQLQENAA